ncbi:MAG: tape measure protein [Xanthobacteraceae bacterium]
MATDLEKLVVQLGANIKNYQDDLNKAYGVTTKQARAIEKRFAAMGKNLDGIGRTAARSLIAPLAGIGAALGVREIISYADAWTKAKNSLAVAGVVGAKQADVLERLFQSAQANGAPIEALAGLFGKAAQASDSLGASQEELIKFSDGVAVALRVAGAGASQSQGALTQLGQLLGSARVQAEEFNSVNEGARPILIAVANGLDAAGGSVNKLKQLVNDGKVSGQQFFQAFLKGLPTIQAMAANATQTIEQGVTKVNNAFTKYIGQTDESLSGSQRLVAGLNALADNFEGTADVVLQLAGIIAGALVGRSIAGMIVKLGLATTALAKFVGSLRAAMAVGSVSTAIGGLSAVAGPLGVIIGGTVVAALALFSGSSETASAGARTYAEALKLVEAAAKTAAPAIDNLSASQDAQFKNSLAAGAEAGAAKIAEAKEEALNLLAAFSQVQSMSLITEAQYTELARLHDGIESGKVSAIDAKNSLYAMANADYNFQEVADAIGPILQALANAIASTGLLKANLAAIGGVSFRGAENASMASYDKMVASGSAFLKEAERRASLTKDQLALETQIAEVRKEALAAGASLTEAQIKALAQTQLAGDAGRKGEGKSKKVPRNADSRFDQDIQGIRDRTAALAAEMQMVGMSTEQQEARRIALDLEQQALIDLREEARRKGETDLAGIELSPSQVQAINDVSEAYAKQAEALRLTQESFDNAKGITKDVFSGLLGDLRNGASLTDALTNAVNRLTDRLLDMALDAAIEALFKNLASSFAGGFGGFTGFNGTGGTPGGLLGHNAQGTQNWRGGPTWVGESGPEVVDAPKGARITPNHALRAPSLPKVAGGGGSRTQVIVNAPPGSEVSQKRESSRDNGIDLERIVIGIQMRAEGRGDYDAVRRQRTGVRPTPIKR